MAGNLTHAIARLDGFVEFAGVFGNPGSRLGGVGTMGDGRSPRIINLADRVIRGNVRFDVDVVVNALWKRDITGRNP
jgi:hypothetical protein